MDEKTLNDLREKYDYGVRVKLKYMEGEPQMEEGLRGTVQDVDDIGQIHVRWDNGSTLALNPRKDNFEIYETEEKIKVIVVEPMKEARVVEMENKYPAMREIVDGDIEQYMPFEDDVCIICNEEGKLLGLPLNRAVYDENGKVIEIMAGTFFIAYCPYLCENFESMPEKLQDKYLDKFREPEVFVRTFRGVVPMKMDKQPVEVER